MDPNDGARIVSLLEQIRNNQATQLELVRRQVERAEKLQDRAEELQTRGMGMMKTARRTLAIILPVVIILIIYVSWILFR